MKFYSIEKYNNRYIFSKEEILIISKISFFKNDTLLKSNFIAIDIVLSLLKHKS